MLCSHSDLAGPFIRYRERFFTGNEIIALRPCFVLSCGRKRKVQSVSNDIPTIKSKGGASRCQFITDPTGYSVTKSSEKSFLTIERCLLTLSISGWNDSGIAFPLVSTRLSKL